MAEKQVEARNVREGDFLPGIGDGYVFEDAETDPYVSLDHRYPINAGDGMALITFHDSEGEECYLILPEDSKVTVRRD